MKKDRNYTRDPQSGQYGFQNNWTRLCVCGHELGYHTAEAPHDCINSDRLNIGSCGGALDPMRVPATDCDCQRFRPSKANKKAAPK